MNTNVDMQKVANDKNHTCILPLPSNLWSQGFLQSIYYILDMHLLVRIIKRELKVLRRLNCF